MPTVVHATRRGWVYAPFTCEHCGHADHGAVYMQASAGAQAGLVQDLDDSRDLALGTAHGNMEQAGDELIALAPCPGCGLRDELAVRAFVARAKPWLAGGGVLVSVGLAGAGYLASKDALFMGLVVTGPLLLIGVVALVVGLAKRLRSLPGGVVFRSVDPRPWAGLHQ
ncbi:hypothetical protein DB30_00540 [Enhygromyxa salina]|uniref:Uncharacterized protein n=1 Tax=Enhygromyxa salina TaxID=215803 RepID=A0A0C2CTY6_9BACT|nr:hypothetical protein [Enhygromyxa salina]KIG13075.1 hypothetical protein DB30_00540 [Enhygromyxa salina]